MGDIEIIIGLNYILITVNMYWIKTIVSELSVIIILNNFKEKKITCMFFNLRWIGNLLVLFI